MDQLIEDTSQFVINFLKKALSPTLVFHTLKHTREVVEAAEEIGVHSKLTASEMNVLITAAWFHDCGYVYAYNGHEDESKNIAKSFLEQHNCSEDFISSVLGCIEATKFPQSPRSTIEMALCDADLYHFTKTTYPTYAQAIRKEFELCLHRIYTDQEWEKVNCGLLTMHSYCTDYGKKVLSKFKEVNIKLMGC